MSVELTFAVINTEKRELLLRGLDAIARERAALPFETEVIVLDNASNDGSVAAARQHPTVDDVVALAQRDGLSNNENLLLGRVRGRFVLFLNEDAELQPGAAGALHGALAADDRAGAAGAQLLYPDGRPYPCAWRFTGWRTAVAGALFLHKLYTVQSRGDRTRRVDWVQSAAFLLRRAAVGEIGGFDPDFFVYGEDMDLCRRLADAGWHTLWVPSARVVHHEQLRHDTVPARRIQEFSRNRELFVRKHEGRAAAIAVRLLVAWSYAVRAAAALVLPGHRPARYWRHVTATLRPGRREGLREAAVEVGRSGRRL